MSVNQIQVAKEFALDGRSEANTTITQAVARAQQSTEIVDTTAPISEQQELQNLRQIISTWRDMEAEVSTLNA
jgi:hypothetical protein